MKVKEVKKAKKIGTVLEAFALYARLLLRIQMQKAQATGNEYNYEVYTKLKDLVLGEAKSDEFGEYLSKSELEIVQEVSTHIDHLLHIKERLIQHIFSMVVRVKKIDTVLYFHLLETGPVPFKEIESFSSQLSNLEEKNVVIFEKNRSIVKAIPLEELKYLSINYFLRIIDTFEPIRKALKGGLFKRSLLSILKKEADALKERDDGRFINLYEKEKVRCNKIFHAYRDHLDENLKIAHAIKDPFLGSAFNLLTKGTPLIYALITSISLVTSLFEAINVDVLFSYHINHIHRQTAISGITDYIPEDGIPISEIEKFRLKEISQEILLNPSKYFVPHTKDVLFKQLGNKLSFDSGYIDRFFGRKRRILTDGRAYATYFPAPNSKKVVVILHARNISPGFYYHLAEELTKKGISSLLMLLPGHDIRKNDTIEGKDPLFSVSVYGSIEQNIQCVNEIILAMNWLEDKGYTHFAIHSTSLSTVPLSILLAVEPRISTAIFITPGDVTAKTLFSGESTQNLKKMYTNADVTEPELTDFWRCISQREYIEKIPVDRRDNIDVYVTLAKFDKIASFVGIEDGRSIAKLIKETLPHTTVEEFYHTHITLSLSSLAHFGKVVNFIVSSFNRHPIKKMGPVELPKPKEFTVNL